MAEQDSYDFESLKNKLNAKYRNLDVHDIVDNKDGSMSLVVGGERDYLDGILARAGKPASDSLPVVDTEDVHKLRRERASVINRDPLSRSYLDLAPRPSSQEASPQELYSRAMEFYRTRDVFGTSIDILTNFASKGMVNDIDDENIRNFFDNWVVDTGFDETVDQAFLEFFKTGFVRTYKIVGKYEPKINYISTIPGKKSKKVNKNVAALLRELGNGNEKAAKKIKWSRSHIPIKYTILNPTQIEIDKSSLMLGEQIVILKASALDGIKELLEKDQDNLTDYHKKLLKQLPSEFKKAAQNGEDLPLDPYLVGAIDYRKQPYELYPTPKGARAFESLEYKKSLRQADYSTLDGITNYLLVITIGNDNFPIKSQEPLESVSELFNTSSKSFNVIWDHTLKVQRIQPQDVGDVLGQDKYRQVNEDITGAFGVIRALIDGVGNPSKGASDLAIKALREEIYYARKQVSRWIYREYRDVAQAMGFDRYPAVRFDNMILKDEIQMMNVIQGLMDRRAVSYRTGHEMLGLNHETIISELQSEKPLVLDGTLGIIGSPYNPKAVPQASNVQDKQRTPKGTPSEGRPPGKPAKTPNPAEKPDDPNKTKTEESHKKSGGALKEILQNLSEDELKELLSEAGNVLSNKVSGDSQE